MPYLIPYKYLKYLSVIPGWYLGDIIGAISSYFLVQELIDNKTSVSTFELLLLRLAELLIKADGVVEKSEVLFVREFFIKKFGQRKAEILFRELKKSTTIPNDLDNVIALLRSRMEPSQYYGVLIFMFALALSDGHFAIEEERFIYKVGKGLGFSLDKINEIKAQFIKPKRANVTERTKRLNLLGLKANATKEEIKAAYRRLAKEYHPDRLVGVSDAVKKMAEEKFKEVSEAYEYLVK